MFHNVKPKQSDIVIVWNGLTGLESQFTATKVSNPQWRPLKGLDWAGDVKYSQMLRMLPVWQKSFTEKELLKLYWMSTMK